MKLIKSNPKKNAGNLYDIIDHSTPFELIYSGVENDSYFDVLYDMGVRNFLMSYHYIQNKHINVPKRFEKLSKIRLFIDSGAHTYQNDPKYSEYDEKYWENHLQNYLKWVERNKDYIFAIANFDFENVVGAETVNRWNREYFEPFMLRTGIPVCFVWHQNSYYDWDFFCKRYPYVGFSSVNTEGEAISLNEYKERLRVAEKSDSVVHGFGMTRTAMLTELPFYTSDSTTWLVGLQYGEMNYWTGTKMSRLKKEAWKGTYLNEICNKYNLNPDKLLSEDTVEMIKANIGAFIDAEKYVQTRLKSQMYWLKARAVKTDVDNLPIDFFPTQDWFDNGGGEDLENYCKKCNINPEYEEAFNLLYDLTAFMTWGDEEHHKMHEWYSDDEQSSLIDELHDTYINRIVPDKDSKIQDLIDFFKSCVSGENDKLLHIGTNFDRTIKERESYVEEDNDELVDVSPEDIVAQVKDLISPNLLKDSEAPEIDELDEEIFRKAEITPIYDENHRLVKGQKLVHKPKQVYSKKFPKLACDTCYAAAKCPEYKAGYVCAYNKMFDRFSTRDMGDIIQATQGIVEYNMTRMQKAMIMETLNGTIDPTVTGLMDMNIKYMQMLKSMYENGSAEVLRQTKVVRADGTQETTTSITNPQGGGIMEKLLSSIVQPQDTATPPTGEVVDIPPQETAE